MEEAGLKSHTIERYTDGLISTAQMKEIVETRSAAKAPKRRR